MTRWTTLAALLLVGCGASPSPAPSPAAAEPAAPPTASAPATAPESASAAPASSTKTPTPPPAGSSAHPARDAAVAEAAQFAMIGCVHTGGNTDPCPDPRPQNDFGDGLGSSKPVPATNGKSKATMREGSVTVNGRLPPEVIQRIVRQNFGRIRLCYEDALKKKPKLAGRVATKFVIERDGSVSMSQDDSSDLPDGRAVACVVASFGKLSFPQPEGGKVTVVYPLVFSAE